LETAMGYLKLHDAIADTVVRARHYGERARDALAPLPSSDVKQALLDVVEFCVSRAG
ncbi:MAG: polyprenyl synthetase family protein, partial [Rhizobiaceae bacterium]